MLFSKNDDVKKNKLTIHLDVSYLITRGSKILLGKSITLEVS